MKTTDFIKESAIAVAAEAMEKESEVQLARQDCHAIAKGAIELYHILKDLPEMTDLDNECVANLNMCAKYIEEALEYFDTFTQPAEGSFTLESAEAKFNELVNEGIDFDQIRRDAEQHLKTSLDKQSDGRIEALKKSKQDNDKSFLQKVGDKQIGMVKGAVKGAWKGLTGHEVEEEQNDFNHKPDDWSQDFETRMKKGVAEGVAESLPMNDAVKVLRHYGASNFKTTSNELHFYKNGRPFSVDLTLEKDATRSVNLSQLNSVARQLKGHGAPATYHDNGTPMDVKEAKGLAKKVRVAKGEHAGKIGWIREIKHGAFKGAPKSFFVDLEDGTQLNNVPGSALRLVKEDAGATGSSSIAAVVGGLGETNGKTKLIKRQGKMSNVLQPPKAIKVKGGY